MDKAWPFVGPSYDVAMLWRHFNVVSVVLTIRVLGDDDWLGWHAYSLTPKGGGTLPFNAVGSSTLLFPILRPQRLEPSLGKVMISCERLINSMSLHYDKTYAIGEGPGLVGTLPKQYQAVSEEFAVCFYNTCGWVRFDCLHEVQKSMTR